MTSLSEGPSAGRKAGARDQDTPKRRFLAALADARATVHESVRGLTADEANEPLMPGKWTVREIVLHLYARDRVRFDEWDAALSGTAVSWQFLDDEAMSRVNRDHLEPLRDVSWAEALRLLDSTRAALVERILTVPDEPAGIWRAEHSFGWMLDALPRHDRHHAEGIRRWRSARTASSPGRSSS